MKRVLFLLAILSWSCDSKNESAKNILEVTINGQKKAFFIDPYISNWDSGDLQVIAFDTSLGVSNWKEFAVQIYGISSLPATFKTGGYSEVTYETLDSLIIISGYSSFDSSAVITLQSANFNHAEGTFYGMIVGSPGDTLILSNGKFNVDLIQLPSNEKATTGTSLRTSRYERKRTH